MNLLAKVLILGAWLVVAGYSFAWAWIKTQVEPSGR